MKNTIKFKVNRPTGKWAWTSNPTYNVIINKVDVGTITFLSNFDKTNRLPIGINLRVFKKDILEDGNTNCVWRTISLKPRFNTVDEAKLFLKEKLDPIVNQFLLYDVEGGRLLTEK